MANKTSTKRRKNPAPAAAGEKAPFPFLDPDYPVKPWVNPISGQRFQTVAVRLDDGRFLATVAEAPEIRATARTQAEAEQAVLTKFRTRKNPTPAALAEEQAEMRRIVEERKNKPTMPWREFLKKYGS